MGAQETPDAADRAIAALATRQYGVVTRADLTRLGVSRRAIERRVAAGRLLRVHRAVYVVGHRAPRRETRWLAAVLACGEQAVLSHRSAAVLWGLTDLEGGLPDVTVRARRRTPGVATHRGRLAERDRTAHWGIPVTSAARTLVDLAHVLDDEDLTRAVREAQFRRLFDVSSLLDALDRRPSRILRALADDVTPTQSRLEDRLLAICDRHRIPRPLTQRSLGGRRVDFVWPAQRVVVETDDYAGHATPSAFQRDRSTDNALQLRGYAVLRFTRADIVRRPRAVADQIRAALRRSG